MDRIKADGIAARQLQVLRQYQGPDAKPSLDEADWVTQKNDGRIVLLMIAIKTRLRPMNSKPALMKVTQDRRHAWAVNRIKRSGI
jgi:hypothetical protein